MRLSPLSHLSYANVTATLALFLALGGGAYAATALPARSVGSRELKANAVTRVKIKNNAINGSKVADGTLLGADIKESTLGPVPLAQNSAAIGQVTYKSAASGVPGTPFGAQIDSVATGTVTCNPGQHAISGGAKVDNPAQAFIVDTYPDVGDTAWTVRIDNISPAPVGFTVVAICTAVTKVG